MLCAMSVDLSHVELPEDWEQAVVRARAVFSVGAIVAEGSSSSRSSIRPRSSSSSSSSSKERVKGQINNPEFEKKIKREATGRFGEKPRANIKLAKEETVEDFAPPADSYDEEQLNKRRGEAFERFSEDNKLDDKEKAVIEQWNRKMEQVQKVSPPPGDKVEKGRLEELKKEAFKEFQKDKKLDKNELELVRKWDEKLKEAEKREGPEESKGPNLPNPFLLALAPAIGVAGVAGIQAGSELAKKAREALDGSEIGAELEGSVKAQFGDLSLEAKAGVAAGLKNPEERPGIIEGFINGFLDVEVSTGGDEESDKPSKPIPLPRKPKPESEPESDKPSEPIPLPRKPKPEPESEPEPEPEPESESEQDSGKYTVQKGDNLWDIVKANLPEGASNAEILEKTKGLYESNKETVGDDWNLIHPGQELDLGSLKPQPEPETPDSGAQEELPGKGEGEKEKDEDEGEEEKDEGEKEKDEGINPFLALLSPALALGLYAADKVGDAFKDSSFEASVKGEAKTRFGEMSSESQASMAVRLGNPETRKEAIQEFGGQRTAELKASISAKIQAGLDPESPTVEKLLKELEKQKQ